MREVYLALTWSQKTKTICKAFSRDKCFSYSIHVILGFVVVSDGKKIVMIVTLVCYMTFAQEIYTASPVSGKLSPCKSANDSDTLKENWSHRVSLRVMIWA